MDIYDIRRKNLQTILSTQFNNYRTGLAMAIERQPSYISRCLSSQPLSRKRIGEDFARHIEEKLKLPPGALDVEMQSDAANARPLSSSDLENTTPLARQVLRSRIAGTAPLGTNGHWDQIEKASGWVELLTMDPDAYSMRIKGDAMAPTIRNGWVVWFEPNRPLVPGEYVKVLRRNGISMIKEMLYENESEVSFMSVNDGYGRRTIPRDEIEHLHYVGGIIQPSKVEP